jgi:amphi-Trp domain-containing protein
LSVSAGTASVHVSRLAAAGQVADVLASLAQGVRRGELTLESGGRALRLCPTSELTLELVVSQKDGKGRIALQLAWKPAPPRGGDLRVAVGRRSISP